LARAVPTFAVLGNHDVLGSPAATEKIVAALRAQGVRVLRNEHRIVPVRNGRGHLVLVAVDDPSLGHDDLATAMVGLPAAADPARPTILLGHAPEIVDRAPPARFALTVAGHTHGGQLRFSPFKHRTPLELPMIAGGLDSPYARGTHVVHGNPLFVNSGLGVSGIPFRFLAPPQVACFTLDRGIDADKPPDDPARFLTPMDAP
jgi:predicted MPP superfamily phosphohydrolase